MAIFMAVAGARGATVRVKCPHCGKVQVRARAKETYRCNACHRGFDAATGRAEARATGAPGRRRPR